MSVVLIVGGIEGAALTRGVDYTLTASAPLVSSFAEAPDGELYVISQARGVLRIEPR